MEDRSYLRENLRRRARYEAVFIGLILAALLIVVLNINIGSVPISITEIAKIIFTRTGDPTQVNIIWK
ncbi:MAG: iron ABC transporter permease, partial [Oscillospiraceae bacterium]|nr:iron ABC transporter permease [Oscillospiraceae bacterium]